MKEGRRRKERRGRKIGTWGRVEVKEVKGRVPEGEGEVMESARGNGGQGEG